MERDHAWFVPFLDERKQVHASVTKINMHQINAAPRQKRSQHLVLSSIYHRRSPFNELEPSVAQKIHPLLGNNFDIGKRKPIGVLQLLCHDKGVNPTQRFYLPINVQHLWLEKARAIARYDSFTHTRAPSVAGDGSLVHPLITDDNVPVLAIRITNRWDISPDPNLQFSFQRFDAFAC